MVTCPVCYKNFHACGSCCFAYSWEYKYCSEKCWRQSDEYNKFYLKSLVIIEKFKDNLDDLKYLIELDNDYIYELSNMIEERIKK